MKVLPTIPKALTLSRLRSLDPIGFEEQVNFLCEDGNTQKFLFVEYRIAGRPAIFESPLVACTILSIGMFPGVAIGGLKLHS